MSENICEAIEKLPQKYITTEMAMDAARERDFKLLKFLPVKFITAELLEELFAGKCKGYRWNCDLSYVPNKLRTKEICRKAVEFSRDNLHHIPIRFRDREMAKVIVSHTDVIEKVYLIPAALWDRKLVYSALDSMRLGENSSYRPYESADKKSCMQLQVLLHYIPDALKDRAFYRSLFEQKIAPQYIDLITPTPYKDKEYYLLMAQRKFSLVPFRKQNYAVMLSALGKGSNTGVHDIFNRGKGTDHSSKDILFSLMDDRLADAVIEKDPQYFKTVPERFQTHERLILAVKSVRESAYSRFDDDFYSKELLTLEVVEEFIRQGIRCDIPPELWNPQLAAFCLEHGERSFFWFKQMPPKLQTRQIVAAAFKDGYNNLEKCLKKHITKEMTTQTVRYVNSDWHCWGSYLKYLPSNHFTDFTRKTGLPERFMGGEVDLLTLKNKKPSYAYCKLGNVIAGLYTDDDRYNPSYYLVITRPGKDEPAQVLKECYIGSFHKTWLEKAIADYDPTFIKPKVEPDLKDVQSLSYYGVEFIERNETGIDIYRNTFQGVTVGYCAKKDGMTYHDDTILEAVSGWQYKVDCANEEPETVDAGSGVNESRVVTAFFLNKRYGFCQTGMTAFTEDYGLDYYSRYSIGELRQAVAQQGRKPSTYTYRRELRQINVI